MNDNIKLIQGYCYLVRETVLFIQKHFEGIIPAGRVEEDIYWKTKELYNEVQALLICNRRQEVEVLLEDYLEYALTYYKNGDVWNTLEHDRKACRNIVLNSIQMMVNLTVLLEALEFLPAKRVSSWLNLSKEWQVHRLCSGTEISEAGVLCELVGNNKEFEESR